MKKFIVLCLAVLMLVSAMPLGAFAKEADTAGTTLTTASKLPFIDVKESSWFYGAVKYSFEEGIFKGTNSAGTTFSPNRTMTRIEFATTLFRLSGAEEADYQGESTFPDIPSNNWMTAPANWASEKGYVLGNDKGMFMPNKTLDRQTLSTMLYRFACDVYDTSDARATAFDKFGDAAKTADWAKEAVTWMVTVELINGTGKTVKGAPTLAPAMAASRAQVAQILMNYANLHYNEEYPVGDIYIGENSISEYIVVYGSGCSNIANEFAKYIKMATGFELPVVSDGDAAVGEKEILIGKTNREGNTVNVNRSKCEGENESFIYAVQNGNLIITSNEQRNGTAYGVYDFLEHYAGLNFFGEFETVDNRKAFYVPADLNYFEISATSDFRVLFSEHNGDKWKSDEVNGLTGFYHSLPSLGVDPSEFDPSWSFQAEVHKSADPCLTDPAIQQNIITNVRTYLNKEGRSGIWVAMSDGSAYCKCKTCAAYYREHGRMGTYFNILDVVADALEEDHPDARIVGLAYKYIWSKLENFDAEDINDSVTVVVCTDNMCASHFIDDPDCANTSNPNATYEKDLGYKVQIEYGFKECFDTIVELASNVYVWDYIYPANHNEAPIPLFHRMYANYTYFFENGVTGVFCQNHTGANACFALMREYMAAKMLSDGGRMTEKEYWGYIDEFLEEYYGDGWTYIREYIDYTYELSTENEWHIWSNEDWNDIITEEQYRENFSYLMGLWETAESLAQTEEMKERVRRDSTQMKYIELCLAYKDYENSAQTAEDLKAYTDLRDAYVVILETYGFDMPDITSLNPEFWGY